jgi:hypothetical protein
LLGYNIMYPGETAANSYWSQFELMAEMGGEGRHSGAADFFSRWSSRRP